MVISISHHASERIEQRFNNDIYFKNKFKWILKQIKRWKVIEHPWKRENTVEAIYDRVKYIYQKIWNERKLITTYSM